MDKIPLNINMLVDTKRERRNVVDSSAIRFSFDRMMPEAAKVKAGVVFRRRP